MTQQIVFDGGDLDADTLNSELAEFREQVERAGSEAAELAAEAGLVSESRSLGSDAITAQSGEAPFGDVVTIILTVATPVAQEVFDRVILPWIRRRRGKTALGDRK